MLIHKGTVDHQDQLPISCHCVAMYESGLEGCVEEGKKHHRGDTNLRAPIPSLSVRLP